MFGQKVGKIVVPKEVLLAGTTRTFTGTNPNAFANNETGVAADQQLVWPEHFLLGEYSATLTLSLSDKGPTYTRTIHFLAIPLISLGYALISLLILCYISLRIKKAILR